jgi:hypothetical protein
LLHRSKELLMFGFATLSKRFVVGAMALVLCLSALAATPAHAAARKPAPSRDSVSIIGLWAGETTFPNGEQGTIYLGFVQDGRCLLALVDAQDKQVAKTMGTWTLKNDVIRITVNGKTLTYRVRGIDQDTIVLSNDAGDLQLTRME